MSDRTVILNFHGVGTPGRSVAADEQAVWLDEPSFLEVLDEVAQRPGLRLTFDDGNTSDLHIAAPALEERDLRAEFFVLAGRLGEPGYLSADEVRELAARGMSVGSHGLLHRTWRSLPAAELDEEIRGARTRLEDLLQAPVRRVSCPFGSYDRRVLGHLRRARVERVYTSDRGAARDDAWLQPRNTIHDPAGAGTLDVVLAETGSLPRGAVRAVKRLVKRLR